MEENEGINGLCGFEKKPRTGLPCNGAVWKLLNFSDFLQSGIQILRLL